MFSRNRRDGCGRKNAQAGAYYNVLRAGPGSISTPGDWQFRFELALLFPE
jgi:hypothetical protein